MTANDQQNTLGLPADGLSKRRRRIVFGVSTGLFLLALALPLWMQYRQMGRFDSYFSDMFDSLRVVYAGWIKRPAMTLGRQKVGIALWTMMLVVAGRLLPRKKHIMQWTINILLVYMCVLAYHNECWKLTRSMVQKQYIQFWNVYHYYFGSKYFDEMGYFYQYAYTLKADAEGGHYLTHIQSVNDLIHYERKSRAEIIKMLEGRNDFTPERWEQFKQEMQHYLQLTHRNRWHMALLDHGYNGTPFWNSVGAALANQFPLTEKNSRIFVLSLDQIFLLITFIVVAIVFGFRWGVVSATTFLILFINQLYTVAGFIRYDWFCATIIGFCLFHKKYYKLSAPFFAYATMARIFPALFLLGPGIKWLIDWIRNKKMDRRLFTMFVLFVLCCAIGFGIGTLNRHGLNAWKQFYKNIRQHTALHYLGPKRIGLKHLFVDDLSTPDIINDYRRKSFKKQRWMWYGAATLMGAMFFLVILRRSRSDSFILGLLFIFTVLVLSRYYWALMILLFLLQAHDRSRWRQAYADVLMLMMVPLYYLFYWQMRNNYASYMTATWVLLGLFVYLSVSYLIEDFFVALDWWRSRRGPARLPTGEQTSGDQPAT